MSSPDRSDVNSQPDGPASTDLGPDVATEVQALFLLRLRELLEKRYGAASAKLNEAERRMLDRAIYSTFCDCLELNVSNQARALLRELHNS